MITEESMPVMFPKWDNGEAVEIAYPRRNREWLSLSDDEMMVFLFKYHGKSLVEALREFEIALMEKNNAN